MPHGAQGPARVGRQRQGQERGMTRHTSTPQRPGVTPNLHVQVKDDEALRRPFACGVMSLAELGLGLGKESEHSMKMFAPKEEEKFGVLPDRTLTGAPPRPLLS